MIKIDIFFALSAFLFLFILLVFIYWVSYNYNENKNLTKKQKEIIQCPYCTFILISFTEEKFIICPKCKSIIKAEENNTQ